VIAERANDLILADAAAGRPPDLLEKHMQAKDVMTSPVVTVGPDDSVTDIARLLLERHISATPVVDEAGALLGVVSEGDLYAAQAGTERRPSGGSPCPTRRTRRAKYLKATACARDVMTRHVLTVYEDASLRKSPPSSRSTASSACRSCATGKSWAS
jgi:CBS domain-containing protein